MHKIIFIAAIFFPILIYGQKFNELAKTPPMGWNSWNKIGTGVNEKLIREAAEAMVKSGMKDAGYEYINIDDYWQGKRDSLGFIHPDPERFPSGMKALGDYIHSLGLKFGIYSDAGWNTCGGKPASRGHEYQDAITYAKWGVDYLKYDWCNTEFLNPEGAYLTMNKALYSAGRPVVFSICEWGNSAPWRWAKDIGNLWRTTTDISPVFDSVVNHGTWHSFGVMQIVDRQDSIRQYAGPGHWNDPDMLEVGNGMSFNEDQAHFSLWCMLAAPLIAGNDLFNMSKETKEILTNKEAIAVDQDSLGIEGFKYSLKDGIEIWLKPLEKGDWAICFLNRGLKVMPVTFSWKKHKIFDSFSKRGIDFQKDNYIVRDLWLHKEIGTTKNSFATKLQPHEVALMRLILIK